MNYFAFSRNSSYLCLPGAHPATTNIGAKDIMEKKKGYTTFNLPVALVEELKVWRQAYMVAWGRTVSYGEIIRTLLDGLDSMEPDVVKAMDFLVEQHPEFAEKIGKYKGAESDDEEFEKK